MMAEKLAQMMTEDILAPVGHGVYHEVCIHQDPPAYPGDTPPLVAVATNRNDGYRLSLEWEAGRLTLEVMTLTDGHGGLRYYRTLTSRRIPATLKDFYHVVSLIRLVSQ